MLCWVRLCVERVVLPMMAHVLSVLPKTILGYVHYRSSLFTLLRVVLCRVVFAKLCVALVGRVDCVRVDIPQSVLC